MATPMPPACEALAGATGGADHYVLSDAISTGCENDGPGLDYYRPRDNVPGAAG